MSSDAKKLLQRNARLNQLDGVKVESHVQRAEDDWIINTLVVEGHSVPFKYKRQKMYRSLQGGYVNLTYYPDTEQVAGMDFEIMKVVRIRRS